MNTTKRGINILVNHQPLRCTASGVTDPRIRKINKMNLTVQIQDPASLLPDETSPCAHRVIVCDNETLSSLLHLIVQPSSCNIIWKNVKRLHSICSTPLCTAGLLTAGTTRKAVRIFRSICDSEKHVLIMYINEQVAQNSCDQTLFSIRCFTCFGLCLSIIRNNFISCTSRLVQAGTIPAYTKRNVQLIKLLLMMD